MMYSLELSTFFGRLHPLIVHLPIGFLILAVLLSSWKMKPNSNFYKGVQIIWLLSCISALFAAIAGWLLAQNGYYIEQALKQHQWTGILLVVFSFVGWIFHLSHFKIPQYLKRVNQGLILIFLVVVGHLGGSLTHGENYLFEFAPKPLAKLMGSEEGSEKIKINTPDSVQIYEDLIQPLFTSKCIACHNEELSRGGLDMTTTKSLFAGGLSGPGITAFSAKKSLIFKRVTLPQNKMQFMPPTGIPMTYEELQLLEWWINEGAELNTYITDLSTNSKIETLLLTNFGLDIRPKPWYEKIKLNPLDSLAFQELENHQFNARSLSVKNPLLDIRFTGTQIKNSDLEVLRRYASYITWLNLSDSALKDKNLEVLAEMENLTRLSLQNNPLTTETLAPIQNLQHLEILNIYNTEIDHEIFNYLIKIKSLKKVFLWDTQITPAELKAQGSSLGAIEIISGYN